MFFDRFSFGICFAIIRSLLKLIDEMKNDPGGDGDAVAAGTGYWLIFPSNNRDLPRDIDNNMSDFHTAASAGAFAGTSRPVFGIITFRSLITAC